MNTMDQQGIISAVSIICACFVILSVGIAAAYSDSKVAEKAIESIARQPEAKDSIMTALLISIGLIESIPIIAAVIAIVLIFANPFLK